VKATGQMAPRSLYAGFLRSIIFGAWVATMPAPAHAEDNSIFIIDDFSPGCGGLGDEVRDAVVAHLKDRSMNASVKTGDILCEGANILLQSGKAIVQRYTFVFVHARYDVRRGCRFRSP
jgi:hypothetical protein